MQYYGDLLRRLQKESTTGVGMYFVKNVYCELNKAGSPKMKRGFL